MTIVRLSDSGGVATESRVLMSTSYRPIYGRWIVNILSQTLFYQEVGISDLRGKTGYTWAGWSL